MKVNSNLIKDIIHHYKERLVSCFSESEASSLLYTLIDHFFGISKLDLVKQPNIRLSESELLKIHFAVKDLLKHKPIQYITGKVEFLDLEIRINEEILIPRPETEQLVQLILADLNNYSPTSSVLDIGTGSGCIPLALKHHQSTLRVSGIDISEQAIELARINAETHQLQNILFCRSNWYLDIPLQTFDLIVSNPPYIRQDDEHLSQGDVQFEPELALVAGPDGMQAINMILENANRYLASNASLLIEHGHDQKQLVQKAFLKHDFRQLKTFQDLSGQDRITRGQATD